MKNPFGKTVKESAPYAVYYIPSIDFEYRVLKTYQTPANEQKNQYARWFLATKSPMTYGSYELGDGYCYEILQSAVLVKCTPEWEAAYGHLSPRS